MKELELRVLEMCEALLPKTTERSNTALKQLLADIRKQLEAK
jgi:hypothetical protein